MTMTYTIWHKPTCSTSRFVLNALREAEVEVIVRDYIKDAPSVAELGQALALLGIRPRGLLRRKGTPHDELGLSDPSLDDVTLIAAMSEHPILIERPFVVTAKGTRLARPIDAVREIL